MCSKMYILLLDFPRKPKTFSTGTNILNLKLLKLLFEIIIELIIVFNMLLSGEKQDIKYAIFFVVIFGI